MLLHRLEKAERLNQWVGYLYLPYQILQIAGYRLVGKSCNYEWRRYRPEPLGPTTPAQHVIALTFPAGVCCLVLALQVVMAVYLFSLYYSPQTPWLIFIVLIQPLPFSLYGYLMIFDLLRLRRRLKERSKPVGTDQTHDEQCQKEAEDR